MTTDFSPCGLDVRERLTEICRLGQTETEVRDATRLAGAAAALEHQHIPAARRLRLNEVRFPVHGHRAENPAVELERPLGILDCQRDVRQAECLDHIDKIARPASEHQPVQASLQRAGINRRPGRTIAAAMFVIIAVAIAGPIALSHTAPFPFLLEAFRPSRSVWRIPQTSGSRSIYLTF